MNGTTETRPLQAAYIPNSAMVAYKVENLSRAPYREFREQLAIPFKDLGYVPEIQAGSSSRFVYWLDSRRVMAVNIYAPGGGVYGWSDIGGTLVVRDHRNRRVKAAGEVNYLAGCGCV